MEKTLPVDEAAEAFVELLNANNVDYIFLNPGTDTFPIQEALSKFKALGKRTPKVILCLHESVALAAAHGYFAVTGRPQVVLVHVDIGTLQLGGALHNAQRGRIGVILCAGRAPSTYNQNIRGERSAGIHWIQEQFDQAGSVRNYVKWEYELRSAGNINHVMQRAFQVASTEPCGPVYLTLPRELLMEKIESVTIPDIAKHAPAITPQADSTQLNSLADTLLQAENPLIITGDTGRHPQAVASLVELAESLGARVIPDMVRMSFPGRHPLCSSGFGQPYFKEADAIIIIDKDIPYMPRTTTPREDAKIIHISIDPVKKDIPLWVFPGDVFIHADSGKVLSALNEIISQKITPEHKIRFEARFKQIQGENEQARERQRTSALSKAEQRPISPEWLGNCVNEVIDDDTIIVHEMARTPQRNNPGTLFGSGGSSLGFGMGGALGVKLASPDKTVVSMMGDGCFVFGCPIPTIWAASVNNAPFLSIIFNNQQYHAPRGGLGIRGAYGKDSYSEKTGVWEGIDIVPSPDYALIAQACGAWGRTVEDPSELMSALKDGLAQVRQSKPALIDVRLENPYP
ncbi:thiamine pyrophosphate-requiring protein [Chloroflexota bacterium]